MKSRVKKTLVGCGILAAVAAVAAAGTYIAVIPAVVSNSWVINKVEDIAKDVLKADLTIENPKLKTGFNTDVAFTLGKISQNFLGAKYWLKNS